MTGAVERRWAPWSSMEMVRCRHCYETEGGKREVIELNCIVGYFTTSYFIVEYANTFIIFYKNMIFWVKAL